jgi:hypothetical protein
MRITSRQKGDELERAVRAIELAILRQSPSYHEKTIRIEGKKRFTSSAGVPHEADIWVSVEVAAGYEATFIFECKNWKRKVGKKEAADFARKIDDAKAQRGFFVAAALTKGAEAVVKSDPRMEWLVARELSADEVPERVKRFYCVFSETLEDRYHIVQKEDGAAEAIDLKSAVFTVHGEPEDLVKYLREWTSQVMKPTSEGVHPFEAVRQYLEWSPKLRQPVKTQNPFKGELSHGIIPQVVHKGVQAGRGAAAGRRCFDWRSGAGAGSEPERAASLAA